MKKCVKIAFWFCIGVTVGLVFHVCAADYRNPCSAQFYDFVMQLIPGFGKNFTEIQILSLVELVLWGIWGVFLSLTNGLWTLEKINLFGAMALQ